MTQLTQIQRLVRFSTMVLLLAPLSAFAEERPDWRTMGSQVAPNVRADDRYEVRHIRNADLEGEVLSVAPDGDSFILRTHRERLHVAAQGGVVVYYRGARYRVRDLERGDIVAVDLFDSRSYPRARSVEVLRSVSHRGGRYDDRWGRNGRDDRYDRDGRSYDRDGVVVGQLVSIDARRETMILRVDGREVRVDARRLDSRHGRSWERSLRIGDRIEVSGRWDGRTFVAESIRSNGGTIVMPR